MKRIKYSLEQTRALDLLEDDHTTRVLFGGQAGGGKSFFGSSWQIEQRIKYPGTRGYIGRNTLALLKKSILVTFFDLVNYLDLSSKIQFKEQKSRIEFWNGSVIELLELDYKPRDPDFNYLGSTEFTDGFIEEGITIYKRACEILLSRTRYKHDEYNLTRKQLITCNPGPGWIKDDIVVPILEGKPYNEKNAFVPATLESNPNQKFVTLYKENLESMDNAYDRARLLHGDWYAVPQTGGEFYKDFKHDKHVVQNAAYDPDLALHISLDENVNPYLACTIWQLNGKKATQIDEITMANPRNTLHDTCKEFAKRYHGHRSGLFIYGDATSKKQDTKLEKGYNFFKLAVQYLKEFHPVLRVPKANPSVIMRGNFLNTVFRSEFDNIEIRISDICSNSILDLQMLKEDSDGKKKKQLIIDPLTRVSYQQYGHCSDTLDYLICEAYKDSFTKYQKGPDDVPRQIHHFKRNDSY